MNTFTVYLENRQGNQKSFTTKAQDWQVAEDLAYKEYPTMTVVEIKNEDTGKVYRF